MRNRMINDKTEFSYGFLKRLIDYRELCVKNKLFELEKATNVMQFIVMSNLDFSLLMDEVSQNDSNFWKQKLYSRILAMMIYEYIDDIPELINVTFLKKAAIVKVPKDSKLPFGVFLDSIKSLKKRKGDLLMQIRNNTIAHKEHNVNSQIKIIDNISVEDLFYLAGEMIAVSLPIIKEFNVIFKKLGTASEQSLS